MTDISLFQCPHWIISEVWLLDLLSPPQDESEIVQSHLHRGRKVPCEDSLAMVAQHWFEKSSIHDST